MVTGELKNQLPESARAGAWKSAPSRSWRCRRSEARRSRERRGLDLRSTAFAKASARLVHVAGSGFAEEAERYPPKAGLLKGSPVLEAHTQRVTSRDAFKRAYGD